MSEAKRSTETEEVPAFLRGDHGPVYRASGPIDYQTRAHSSPFSSNMGGKSPAPLRFSSSPRPDALQQWNQFTPEPTQPSLKHKNLEPSFGNRTLVAAEGGKNLEEGLAELHVTQHSEITRGELNLDESSDEEVAEHGAEQDPSLHTIVASSTSTDATEVLSNLALVFERSIDYEVNFKLRRIECIAHDKGTRCTFIIQQLPLPKEGRFSFELVRRSGSPRLFARTVEQVCAGLQRANGFSEVARPGRAAAALSGGGAAAAWEGACELDAASCRTLVEMCNSEFSDVQREALSSVAALLDEGDKAGEVVYTACGASLLKVLENAGRSRDEDVRWHAAVIAAQMCAVPEFAQAALALVPMLFALLALPTALGNFGCRRRAALALQRITRKSSDTTRGGDYMPVLRAVSPYLGELERHFDSPDPVLQSTIRLLVVQLSS